MLLSAIFMVEYLIPQTY